MISRGLRQPKHEVHILHRLTRSSLDQIIDHRKHNGRGTALRTMHGDTAHVRAPYAAGLGMRALRHDVDKRLTTKAPFEDGLKVDIRFHQARVQRRKNAAIHRHEVWDEHESDFLSRCLRESLPDLRQVTVARDGIRGERIRSFAEQ
jgi:hypothetical protein